MNDQLSGQLDLGRLFDSSTAQGLVESLNLGGAATTCDANAICATIGSPRFDDDDAASAAQKSGPAAGFLSAWQRHGVGAVAQVRGAYAVVIVNAQENPCFWPSTALPSRLYATALMAKNSVSRIVPTA